MPITLDKEKAIAAVVRNTKSPTAGGRGGGIGGSRQAIERFSRMAAPRLFALTLVHGETIAEFYTAHPLVQDYLRKKLYGAALLFDSSLARRMPAAPGLLSYSIGVGVEGYTFAQSVEQAMSFSGQKQLYVYGGSDALGPLFDRELLDKVYLIKVEGGAVKDCGSAKYPTTKLERHYTLTSSNQIGSSGATVEEYSIKIYETPKEAS